MEKSQIIKLRNLYDKTGYTVTGDNVELFTNKPESDSSKEFILWDDTNELVYSVRINHHYDTQRKKPVILQTTTYDMIQYISAIADIDEFEQIMNSIKSEVDCDTLTPDQILALYKEAYKK